jgi:hypothetical protein
VTDTEKLNEGLRLTCNAMQMLQGRFANMIANAYVEVAYNRLHQAELDLMAARAIAVQDENDQQPEVQP